MLHVFQHLSSKIEGVKGLLFLLKVLKDVERREAVFNVFQGQL